MAPGPGDGFFTIEPPGKPTLSSIIKIKCSYIQSKQRWTKSPFNQLKLVLLHAAAAAQNDFYATKKLDSERFPAQFPRSKSLLQDSDHYLNAEHNEVTTTTLPLCVYWLPCHKVTHQRSSLKFKRGQINS